MTCPVWPRPSPEAGRSRIALRHPDEAGIESDDADLGHLFTVFSPKGGAGKTTFSVNVSVGLAVRGFRTLLIDLDLAFGDVPDLPGPAP